MHTYIIINLHHSFFHPYAYLPTQIFTSICLIKEGNILFNDALTTFYLWLYGVGHMVKDHSDSERKPAASTWATLSDYQQGFFYMHHPTDRITLAMSFVTPVVEHWLE